MMLIVAADRYFRLHSYVEERVDLKEKINEKEQITYRKIKNRSS
jgi:hypothetical protein